MCKPLDVVEAVEKLIEKIKTGPRRSGYSFFINRPPSADELEALKLRVQIETGLDCELSYHEDHSRGVQRLLSACRFRRAEEPYTLF